MSAYVHTGTATTAEELRITHMLSAVAAGGVNNGFVTQLSPLAAAEAHGLDRAAAEELQRTLGDLELTNRKFESA